MRLVIASLPIAWLVIALGIIKVRAYIAAIVAFILAVTLAAVGFDCSFAQLSEYSLSGLHFAIFPICFIILAALFTYRLCECSGAMLVIRNALGNVSKDARVITLLVAWGFGNFMEGIAGFGSSVAIPAAVMAGLGISPLRAVIACLIANSVSTAFGSVGVSAMALAKASEIDRLQLAFAGFLEMSVGFLLVPFMLVVAVSGFRALRGVWWLCLAAGVSFFVPCMLISRLVGPELPNVIGAIFSIVTIGMCAKKVKICDDYRLQGSEKEVAQTFSFYHIFRAASPFLFVVISLSIYAFLPSAAQNLLTPGLVILVAAALGGTFQRISFTSQLNAFMTTFWKNLPTYLTISAALMMARVMDESGMIAVLAKTLVRITGRAYVICAPFVGALGGFVTGSGTSSNLIFGALQAQAAESLGLSQAFVTASNMFGAGIGKMICPQSLAIGLAAVGLVGEEATLLKSVLGYLAVLLVIAALSTCLFTL